MKRFAITLLTVLMAATIAPTFAQEAVNSEKDQCLLYSKGCKTTVDSIQTKVKRLQKEIKKGKRVYTAAELKRLQQKLDETNEMLDDLLKGGK